MDLNSERGFHLVPGGSDGSADALSTSDLWLMRYHQAEDRHGLQGTSTNDALGPYLNGEDIRNQDVVVWYAGHLSHHAHDGGDDWHSTGPNLIPLGNW